MGSSNFRTPLIYSIGLATNIFFTSAYAEQFSDNIGDNLLISAGDVIHGQFSVPLEQLATLNVTGAEIHFVFDDDVDPTVFTSTSTSVNNYTNTVNFVRTSTKTTTITNHYTDSEPEQVEVSVGSVVESSITQNGYWRTLTDSVTEGPFPVPVEECNITYGTFTTCSNVYVTNTYDQVNTKTGTLEHTIALDTAALKNFLTSGIASYQITAGEGDIIFTSAILTLDIYIPPPAITQVPHFGQPLNDLINAYAINDKGEVAGQASSLVTSDGGNNAALWRNGVVTDLGRGTCRETVSICWGRAYGLNNASKLVGVSFTANSWPSLYNWPWGVYYQHETIWDSAESPPRLIRTLGHEYGSALDINESGVVVGHGRSVDWTRVNGDYVVHGFIWRSNEDVVEIGSYGQASKALAINNNNQVTGEIANIGSAGQEAFLWDNGVLTTLGHFGSGRSTGNDINDKGEIVGSSDDADNIRRAFVWRNGVMHELGGFDGETNTEAKAINEAGYVVGHSGRRAVIWEEGRIVDINTLLTEPTYYPLVDAVDINENGQIVAVDSYGHPVLVSPPPPADVTVCAQGCDATTISRAIYLAPVGGKILVHPGTYPTSLVTVGDGKQLVAWQGPEKTIIDGQNGYWQPVSVVNDGVLDGFTIQNTRDDCVELRLGGTVKNSHLTGCGKSGVYINYGGNAIDNVITGNHFSGIYTSYGVPVIRGNLITNNTHYYDGAGIALFSPGTGTVVDGNTITNNTANGTKGGGGLFIANGSPVTITNNVIANNTAMSLVGGAIYAVNTGSFVRNNTITGNNSGIYTARTMYIDNTILWGNGSDEVNDVYAVVSHSIVQGGVADIDGNIDADPSFVDAANGDYHLQSGSPAIDTGKDLSADGVTTDISGVARPVDGDGLGAGSTGDGSDFDMGAYEHR